jgi:hypothetical protein
VTLDGNTVSSFVGTPPLTYIRGGSKGVNNEHGGNSAVETVLTHPKVLYDIPVYKLADEHVLVVREVGVLVSRGSTFL